MKFLFIGLFTVFTIFVNPLVHAGPREQAHRIFRRITGVPPKRDVLIQMQLQIQSGDTMGAVQTAMEHPKFYNLVLKNWVKPWSNVDLSPRVPFNDYVATVLGLIRDDVPFDRVLYEDILYIASDQTPGDIPGYSPDNNDHYAALERLDINLKQYLVRVPQSENNNISDTAGVITTRASGEAFFSAGTNRRVTRFSFINFMCRDFEQLHDPTIPDFRVRRDVDRKPGGDSLTYKNKCAGCHAGQDSLGGAWAYFDYVDGQLLHSPGQVVSKMNHNEIDPSLGYITTDDSWMNLWASGQNANLGWKGSTSGNGAKSFGRMIAASDAFATCMANKAYKLLCLKDPQGSEENFVNQMAEEFKLGGSYNMKNLLAKTMVHCRGN